MKTLKAGKYNALFTLAVSILWLVLMIAYQMKTGTIMTEEDAVGAALNADTLFYANYINAVLITLSCISLFSILYLLLKDRNPVWAAIGFVFIPIYGVLNLFVYFSQISIIPHLALTLKAGSNGAAFWIGELFQARTGSTVSILNGLAYAILGIPSLLYGVILLRGKVTSILAGLFLILSSVCSIAGIVGLAAGNPVLLFGTLAGGVFFIISLTFLFVFFRGEKAA